MDRMMEIHERVDAIVKEIGAETLIILAAEHLNWAIAVPGDPDRAVEGLIIGTPKYVVGVLDIIQSEDPTELDTMQVMMHDGAQAKDKLH